jgi:ATP-binding cassette subfamily B protein
MMNLKSLKNTSEMVWYFFRPYGGKLVLLFVVMFAAGALETLNMAALYPVINSGLKLDADSTVLNIFNGIINSLSFGNYFLTSCVLLIAITIAAVVLKYVYSYLMNKLTVLITGDIQKRVIQKLVSADYAFFSQNQQGKLIHAGTIAPDHVSMIVMYTIKVAYDVIACLLMFSLLLTLTWQGTLLLVAVGSLYGVFVKGVIEKVIGRCARIANEEDRKKNVILNELINGIKAVKVFLTGNWWVGKYTATVDRSMRHRYRMQMGRVFPESFMRFTYFIILATFGIVLSGSSPEKLILSLPLFGTFALVAARFFPSIQALGNDLMVVSNSLPNTRITYDMLQSDINAIADGKQRLDRFCRSITFRDVWFKYDDREEYLLKGVSLSIEKRKVTAIVGPSGGGKTTLINLLLKLFRPAQGTIAVDGVDIFDCRNASYLSKIGYVGQETFIFNDTIRENIAFGMEPCSGEMITEAAMLANAHEFIMNTEHGYDTHVGDSGMKLSGGQRQRISIARAMLRKPEILVLDEATSALDNLSEKLVQDAINAISQHTTIVVIAHRLSTVQNADKIVVLEDGVVREEGRHEELVDNNGLYYSLYTRQAAYAES